MKIKRNKKIEIYGIIIDYRVCLCIIIIEFYKEEIWINFKVV